MATRHERVVLSLEDNFTTGMARAAASAALLNRELDSLSKDSVRTQRSFTNIERSSTSFGRSSERTGNQIDKLSGRLRILTDVATVLGPGLIPIGAVGVPAVAGLAAQLGFAAAAGGTAVLAFQGVGDALKAVNKAGLEPTAANLEAARAAMQQISPDARRLVRELHDLAPEIKALRDAAAGGLFPGVIDGLQDLETALPRVEKLVGAIATELGDIAADTGASLASDRWAPFLEFIAREAPEALGDMAAATGNVVHALSELWMAADPLNDDFSRWLVATSQDLDDWATHVRQTDGFADFLAYVETTGPKVADAFGAIANATLQIVQAAAPLGGPVVEGVEALANLVSAIADSEIGTPLFTAAAALALFNRTLAITRAVSGTTFGQMVAGQAKASLGVRTLTRDLSLLNRQAAVTTLPGKNFIGPLTQAQTALTRVRGTAASLGKSAALVGGLAVVSTGATESLGLTNAATLALAGSWAGAPGVAIGAGAGFILDIAGSANQATEAIDLLNAAVARGEVAEIERRLGDVQARLDDINNITGPVDLFQDGWATIVKGQLDDLGGAAFDARHEIDDIRNAALGIGTAGIGALLSQGLGKPMRQTAQDIDGASNSLNGFLANLSTYEGQLGRVQTRLNFRNSLRSLQQTIDDNPKGRGLSTDLNTKAGVQGDAIRQQLLASISAAQKVVGQLSEAQFAEGLRRARRQILGVAEALQVPRAEVEAMLDKFGLLDRTKVAPEVDAKKARRGLRDIESDFDRFMNREFRVPVDADIKPAQRKLARLRAELDRLLAVQRFEVKPQLGRDFATGGWTGPGSKYQPAGVVHADEFVFSKEATSGNVAYLDRLHRQLRGYADGGLVQRFPTPMSASVSGGVAIDYARLGAEVARSVSGIRPLYGDVHVQPHNYGEFKRQMEADRRAAGSDGVRR